MGSSQRGTTPGSMPLMCASEECDGCGDCVAACKAARPLAKGRAAIQIAALDGCHTPILCRNCHDAPCVAACMAGCRHKDEGSGRVITDYERCVGCWMCVMACPFGAIARVPAHQGEQLGLALKCDGCLDEAQAPCVLACQRQVLKKIDPIELARRSRIEAARKFVAFGPETENPIEKRPDSSLAKTD